MLLAVCSRIALNGARVHAGLTKCVFLAHVLSHSIVGWSHRMLGVHARLGWEGAGRYGVGGLNRSTALTAAPLVGVSFLARNNVNEKIKHV